VWEHQQLPPDDDDVCKICLDMVKQARDQLESNETQEELKEVFEGSCNFIPVKIVAEECCKLADEFIPELVETLASEMNPQVVCSVAGLCNNAWVDKQLADSGKFIKATPLDEATDVVDDCFGCRVVINELDDKMQTMSRDDLLNNMLQACGRIGSLSDGCSAVIITYFTEIYSFLQKNFKSDAVCHVAGVCSATFHKHRPVLKKVDVVHESNVGVVKVEDDLPCEFCEQLIIHLRDVLVANTTEQEFEEVLKGLCKQTRSFKDECLSIVDEYYAAIYSFLVNNLSAGEVCKIFGLCGGHRIKVPIWPLLPAQTVETLKASHLIGKNNDEVKASLLTPAQSVGSLIPAAYLTPASNKSSSFHRVSIGESGGVVYINNKNVCVFCQYFLHYVQQAITNPKTEAQIEKVVTEACNHLPDAVEGQCREFVETYGNAFMALLAQEIDPSLVSYLEHRRKASNGWGFVVLTTLNDKPTCPLCLLATQSIIDKLKDKRTEEEIRRELDLLCDDLPKSVVGECEEFVNTYEEQLVEMFLADFTPKQICTYLKLCDPTMKERLTTPVPVPEILSNEIPAAPQKRRNTAMAKAAKASFKDSTVCVLCEFVLSKIDEELKDGATEEEIKGYVENVCNVLPKTVVRQCRQFVETYGDVVIALLAQSLDPKEVCSAIKICKSIKKSVKECAVCEASMGAFDELLGDPNLQKDVDKLLKKVCPKLPAQDRDECNQLIDVYGPSILNLVSEVANPRLVCYEIGVCRWEKQTVHLLGGKNCVWGPGYWCQSVAHAKSC
ncbi:Proactivator polypeptide, partial [Zootermopsis nevadensis]